jgi:hypothetical protein
MHSWGQGVAGSSVPTQRKSLLTRFTRRHAPSGGRLRRRGAWHLLRGPAGRRLRYRPGLAPLGVAAGLDRGTAALTSPAGLAARLARPALLGWAAAIAALGLLMGFSWLAGRVMLATAALLASGLLAGLFIWVGAAALTARGRGCGRARRGGLRPPGPGQRMTAEH